LNPPATAGSVAGAPDFSRLLSPRGVAIVGASSDLSRIGGQPLKLLTEYGYRGGIYPVNPKYQELKALPCYPDLGSVPQPCDVAIIALAAQQVPGAVQQCGAAGISFAVVLSSGFSEAGMDGSALQSELAAAARGSGVRLLGPNCIGALNLKDDVRMGFGATLRLRTLIPGPFAMVTQSGGFGLGVVAAAAEQGVGFNYAISTGNEADISALDLIAYFLEGDDTEGVVTFMEGVTDGRRLLALGERALELGKPVLVWKVGNTDVGRQAAASHTARMTAPYALFQAAFQAGGFIEVQDIDDVIDALKVFRNRRLPRGKRVGIVTLSGGAGVLLADRCIEHGFEVPPLSDPSAHEIRKWVVDFATIANPLDATANGYSDNFASYNRVIATVLADPNIDQVIARTPPLSAMRGWMQGVMETVRGTSKPLMLNWPSAAGEISDIKDELERSGIACIPAPGRTVQALAKLNEFAQKTRDFSGRPKQRPARIAAHAALDLQGSCTLGEHRSKSCLSAYGIPVVKEVRLRPDEVESLVTLPLPGMLAVKIDSPDLPHKTEAGAVRLNLGSLEELKTAAREITEAARRYAPAARIEGILLQQMATGVEVIVGALDDRWFGPVVAFGLGGIYAELFNDVTHGFAPFDAAYAKRMICSIRGSALLRGYRGRPALDIDALADALVRISLLIADHAGRISEIDINPMFVRLNGQGVVAADALIVLKKRPISTPAARTRRVRDREMS